MSSTPTKPRQRRIKRLIGVASVGVLGVIALTFVGCIHRSGGTWMVSSAPLPDGWPALSPIDEVSIRAYPVYRAASVDSASLDGDGMNPMFMTLFEHIKTNDIAMTAPVDMGYAETGESNDDDHAMQRMAFLYRTTDLGPTGLDGAVGVEDVPARTYASVGVRGPYNESNYQRGLARVEAWLAGQADYQRNGEARYLGYNGPFTLGFLRYGEVQVPVVPKTR